jgi:hypothetical protein
MAMGCDTTATRPAAEIPVTLFREILLVPFAIEWGAGHQGTPPVGPELAGEAAKALRTPWHAVGDRLRHLREDRETEPGDRDLRARSLAPAYEELVYFEPYVQRFLYGQIGVAATEAGGGRDAIHLFSRDDLVGLEIEYRTDERAPDMPVDAPPSGPSGKARSLLELRFDVVRCNLYLFDTGNAMLALEVELKEVRGLDHITLDHAQRLLESLRRVFPPYFAPGDDQYDNPEAPLRAFYFPYRFRWHYRDETTSPPFHAVVPADLIEEVLGSGDGPRVDRHAPMFEPWRHLLRPLLVQGYETADSPPDGRSPSVVLSQMGDDRAFVLAQIGVPDPTQIARGDWVRLCFADAPERGYPYGRSFLSDFERRHCYDRFWDADPDDWKRTRFLICNYAAVVVGRDETYFRHVLGKHIRRHYFQLVLISYFQKAALLTLSERLAEMLDAYSKNKERFRDVVHHIARDAQHFTHRYWFEDISAQLQGQETFEMLRRELRTRELYQQVAVELQAAEQFLGAEEQAELGRQQARLNIIASFGLALAVTTGIFGMNIFEGGNELFGPVGLSALLISSGLVGALFVVLYWLPARTFRRLAAWLDEHRPFTLWVPLSFAAMGALAVLFR